MIVIDWIIGRTVERPIIIAKINQRLLFKPSADGNRFIKEIAFQDDNKLPDSVLEIHLAQAMLAASRQQSALAEMWVFNSKRPSLATAIGMRRPMHGAPNSPILMYYSGVPAVL